jgi:hypothetical protein
MSDSHEAFESGFNDNPDWDVQRQAIKNAKWEERVVRQLMTLGGLQDKVKDLIQRRYATTGYGGLSFAEFHAVYGGKSFPVFLHSRKIPFLHEITHEQIFGQLKRISNAFYDLEPEVPSSWGDQPRGLVFEWLHAKASFKILHNYDGVSGTSGLQIRWPTHKPRRLGREELLYVEDFTTFLRNIQWLREGI